MKSLEEEILAHPESMNSIDALGCTPLHWAAGRGDARCVATLLNYGADPNILNTQLKTPISYAAQRDHIDCVCLLLEAGAAPDPPMPTSFMVGSPLNCAS
jgi:ankyrin repeat protein